WGTLWALNSEQLALPPRVDVYQHGPDIQALDASAIGPISMPLAETSEGIYFALGKELWRVQTGGYTMAGATWTKLIDLPGYAVSTGALGTTDRYNHIPLGPDGLGAYERVANHVSNEWPDIHAGPVTPRDRPQHRRPRDHRPLYLYPARPRRAGGLRPGGKQLLQRVARHPRRRRRPLGPPRPCAHDGGALPGSHHLLAGV